MVHPPEKSQSHVARDLGNAESTLHPWCKEWSHAGEKACVGSENPAAGEEEIRRFKRELEVTRQERDILQKCWPSFRAPSVELSLHHGACPALSSASPVPCAAGLRQWLL